MKEKPHLLVGLIWFEIVFLLPLLLANIFGVLGRKNWVRITILMVGVSTATSMDLSISWTTGAPDRKQKTQMEWVAFLAESSSPLWRVNAWVDSLEEDRFLPVDKERSRKDYEPGPRPTEEVVRANNVIQSLNSLLSVAHVSGMGLKVVPNISAFTGLRSVNLSGNYIV